MNPLVSVIIPVFNRAHLISRAVDSVLSQDYPSIEIIIVDDASTDSLHQVLQKYHGQIRVYQNCRKKGPAGARNTGLLESRGEYLAFLDSDDAWKGNKISSQLDILIRKQGDFCATWVEYENYQVDEALKPQSGMVFPRIITESFLCTSSIVISRSVYEKIGLMNEEHFGTEDLDYWLRIALQHPLFVIEKPLTVYCRTQEPLQAVSNKFGRPCVDFFTGRIKALVDAKKLTGISKEYTQLIDQTISKLFAYQAYNYLLSNYWLGIKYYLIALKYDLSFSLLKEVSKAPLRYLFGKLRRHS